MVLMRGHTVVKSDSPSPRWRAVLRLMLGQAQIIGAVGTVVLLVQRGPSLLIVWGASLTGLISLISIVLFHVLWKEKDTTSRK